MSMTKLGHVMPELVPEPPVPPGHGQAGDVHGHPAALPRNVVVATLLQPISSTKGCPPKTRAGSSPLAPQLNCPALYNLSNPIDLSHGHKRERGHLGHA